MRYAVAREAGPPDVLTIDQTTTPAPKSGEVLIEVAYAGVNRPDCIQRAGHYPPPADASPIIGLEVAGTVVAIGEGKSEWAVGDRVCALTPGGGYAEYCAAPAEHCLPLPQGLMLLEAASLPENYFTVWNNLFDRVHLSAGETVLVHGGSSGIGLTTIQLAKAFEATVVTTVGGADKAAFCRDIGADHVINYREQDFVAEVATITGKKGVNVVLDMVGAIIDDLAVGDPRIRPDPELAYKACEAASAAPVAEGNVGAGAGGTVGRMLQGQGMRGMKGGLGTASLRLGDVVIGALAVVNAAGDIFDWRTGRIVAGARRADGAGFADTVATLKRNLAAGRPHGRSRRPAAFSSATVCTRRSAACACCVMR